jgi:hypothetical protein
MSGRFEIEAPDSFCQRGDDQRPLIIEFPLEARSH